MNRAVFASLTILCLLSISSITGFIQVVKADSGTIYIRSDGSIDPPTASIQRNGDLYTLTDNIESSEDEDRACAIVVMRNNTMVDGGDFTVHNNGTSYHPVGIDLTGTSNVTIKNVNVRAFYTGIQLISSDNNSVNGNTLTNNTEGIALSYSNNNSMSGNTIAQCAFFGVELFLSDNNSINANTFSDCGLFVERSYENVVADNLVNGKPLVYLEDVSDRVVEDAGQVILVNSNRISVENSNLSHTTSGVELWQTNNKISGNTITDTQSQGIFLYSSSNNSISENNMANNTYYGISLQSDRRVLDSTDNTVFHNNFINDTVEVKSWTSERANIWDNGCEGNYWSAYNGTDLDNDGVGDTGLPWEGVDNYPLMSVYWNPCDIDHDLEVNRTDIGISSNAFSTRAGDALWNPHADITGPEQLVSDGKVDMRDISQVARHFGEHYS